MKGLGLGVNKITFNSVVQAVINLFANAILVFSIYDLGFGNIPVIRARRTGGSTPAERDFTAIEIIDGTLTTWVGVGNSGFISVYYNHKGTNHARITNAAVQHQIVDNGNLIMQGGHAVVDSVGKPGYELDTTVSINALYSVSKIDSYKLVNYIAGKSSPAQGFFNGGTAGDVTGLGVFDGTTVFSDTNENLNLQISYQEIDTGNALYVQKDNLAEVNLGALGSSSIAISRVFGRESDTFSLNGKLATFIGFDTSTRSTKNSIITELNSVTPIF